MRPCHASSLIQRHDGNAAQSLHLCAHQMVGPVAAVFLPCLVRSKQNGQSLKPQTSKAEQTGDGLLALNDAVPTQSLQYPNLFGCSYLLKEFCEVSTKFLPARNFDQFTRCIDVLNT